MKTIYGIGKVTQPFKNAVLAIGVFDGVHIGHQKLIKQTVKRARQLGGQAVVMTFAPHPVHVLRPDKYLPLIEPISRRLELFNDFGVDVTIIVRFTKRFAAMQPERFVKRYLVEAVKPVEIIVGDDFKFGSQRAGTLGFFQEQGNRYGFIVAPVQCVQGVLSKVGSTMIRNYILEGQLKKAEKYLGRKVTVTGVVKRGEARGKKLGFPTANLYPDNELTPPTGVYAVRVIIGKNTFRGMANIGYRPSFKSENQARNIEVHIFNFSKTLYGQMIEVEFFQKIREERTFPTQDLLVARLKRDQQKSLKILP